MTKLKLAPSPTPASLRLLPGVPEEEIRRCYESAPGNEIASGKFASPESSAALVANAFGYFLAGKEGRLPKIPLGLKCKWPPISITLEAKVRFPWSGGRHPCLDVLIECQSALIGIESKRYEPFRSKPSASLSEAYLRPVWGSRMGGYELVCDRLRSRDLEFKYLDAAQLVKHAFGLRTAAQRDKLLGKTPILLYLFAEPAAWPDGRPIEPIDFERHRSEIREFTVLVDGNEVQFASLSYAELLQSWLADKDAGIQRHAKALRHEFHI